MLTNHNIQDNLTSKLIEMIRKACIDTAIEAALLACRIEQWYTGEFTNQALLEELERTRGTHLWEAIAQTGNLDLAATLRLLEATAIERIESAQDVIRQAERLIDEAQGGAG